MSRELLQRNLPAIINHIVLTHDLKVFMMRLPMFPHSFHALIDNFFRLPKSRTGWLIICLNLTDFYIQLNRDLITQVIIHFGKSELNIIPNYKENVQIGEYYLNLDCFVCSISILSLFVLINNKEN